ncbi:MAG: PHP domain-containing protein [Ignavibacteria bacterium]|nr:PHP domain-containing protein [Ignavibacteria bacterium]
MPQPVESGKTGDPVHLDGSRSPSSGLRADLHTHTTHSDGALSPYELIRRAHELGLAAVSITDHDNVGGLDEAIECGKSLGIEVITGLELSVTLGDKDVHLLAYFIDHKNRDLLDYLMFFRRERLKRAERIVGKLNKINVPLKLESVLEQAGVGSVGRPHIANALLDEGLTDTYHEAFERYIGTGGPAYEKKYQLSPVDAFRLINKAQGLSFLAHPGKYTTELELSALIKNGLDGIEVVHPAHDEKLQEYYKGLVNQYFLLESGGSDFHGGKKNDDHTLGTYTIALQIVETMRSRLFS